MAFEFFDPSIMPFAAAFLFIFAIVFALLDYTKIFKGKSVNAVIAFVFGIVSASYEPFVVGLQQFLPIASIVLVILFFVALIKKFFSGQKSDPVPITISLAVALLLLGVFWSSIGFSIGEISSENMLWLIGIFVIILILWMAYSWKGDGTDAAGKGAGSTR